MVTKYGERAKLKNSSIFTKWDAGQVFHHNYVMRFREPMLAIVLDSNRRQRLTRDAHTHWKNGTVYTQTQFGLKTQLSSSNTLEVWQDVAPFLAIMKHKSRDQGSTVSFVKQESLDFAKVTNLLSSCSRIGYLFARINYSFWLFQNKYSPHICVSNFGFGRQILRVYKRTYVARGLASEAKIWCTLS